MSYAKIKSSACYVKWINRDRFADDPDLDLLFSIDERAEALYNDRRIKMGFGEANRSVAIEFLDELITAAVEAERERVWNIIDQQVQYEIKRARPNGPYRFEAELIKLLIFPDGDPKPQTTPAPGGDKTEQ